MKRKEKRNVEEEREERHVYTPSKDVGTEHTANDVAKVRDVVHVRQGTHYQHIPLSWYGKTAR